MGWRGGVPRGWGTSFFRGLDRVASLWWTLFILCPHLGILGSGGKFVIWLYGEKLKD